MRTWALSAVAASIVAALAFWRRVLTADGAAAASVVGTVTLARGGLPAAGAMLAFFGPSSALSRVAQAQKEAMPLAQAKGARRDAWQVLANGGVAAVCVASGQPRGLVGALAAAAADTWATEVGLLARRPPRSITTGRIVAPGTSGGVTPEGLLASAAGAATVGLAAAALGGGRGAVPRALVAGIVGSVVDSWLGATLQAAYFCESCRQPTEEKVHSRCGGRTRLRRGLPVITNDTVNGFATLSGALIALV